MAGRGVGDGELERQLDAYDRSAYRREQRTSQRLAEHERFHEQFAKMRSETIEPVILEERERLREHGHRVELTEQTYVQDSSGVETDAYVSIAVLPRGWDLEGDRYRFRPRLDFIADPDEGMVRVHYWFARPGEHGEGGRQAEWRIEDLNREVVRRELETFLGRVFQVRAAGDAD